MAGKSAPPDTRVAHVASRQHGVVSIHQLRSAGLSDDAVLTRVRAGRLHRIHRGVYAVGYAGLGIERSWMAAVLAYGPRACLSHRSAAALWGLLPAIAGPVDVSLPTHGGRRKRNGISLHRSGSLTTSQVTRQRGIPVTRPSRTIADLRRVAPPHEVRRATRQAHVLGLSIGLEADDDRTRSELEFRFLRLCRRYGLPTPEVNVCVGPLVVDFLWPTSRLIVETDGFRFHRGRVSFENDRARDLGLRALGYEVIRLSHRQVMDEPELVAGVLAECLAGRLIRDIPK